MLTTGVDTIAGTAGRDKISGGVNALSSTNTLQVNDQIDGGDGSDSLTLTVSTDFAGFSGGGFLKGVETVNLTSSVATPETFAAKSVSGVSTYNVTGHVNLENLESTSVRVNLASIAATTDATTANAVNIKFVDEATTGSSTAATIGTSGLGSISAAGAVTTVHILTPGVEALTVNSTGDKASYINLASTGITSLTATGSAGLRVNDFVASTGVKSIDASAMTGAFDVNLSNAANVTTVKGGAANDTIRIDAAALTPTAVIDGGEGTDTLRIDVAASTDMVGAYKMSGVEIVRLGTISGTLTLDLSTSSGVNSVFVSKEAAAGAGTAFSGANASATTSGKSTITGLGETASISIEANKSGTTAAAHLISFENTGAATVSLSKSSSAVSAETIETATDDVLATKATALTVSVPEFTRWEGAAVIAASAAKSITVSGAGDFGHTNDNVIYAPALTSLTVNQENKDQEWKIEYQKGSATTSPLKSLTVNSVGTVLFGSTTDLLAQLQSLDVTNSKAFTLTTSGHLTKLASLTATGSSSTSTLTVGNLGDPSQAYPITVTASGQETGLNIGTIDVASGQSITLNIGGVKGNTSIGAVTVNQTVAAGTIDVNAAGHGAGSAAGDLTLGVLTARTIDVDVTGAKGAVAIGGSTNPAIIGRSVTLDASTAEANVTIGSSTANNYNLSVRDALDVSVPAGKGTTVATAISSGSTAFTGALQGSVTGDTFTFTSASTAQSSITLTGNLGAGTDSLTVISEVSAATTQTIDISGLAGVTSSTIRGALNAPNVITGGAGKDTIHGGASADKLTGGAGADVFFFNNLTDTGQVTVADLANSAGTKFASGKTISTIELDVITDFSAGDILTIDGFAENDLPTSDRVVYGETVTTLEAEGELLNGTYSASANSFTTLTGAADSLFLYSDGANVRGIVLVGFSTGFDDDTASGTTGIVGTTT